MSGGSLSFCKGKSHCKFITWRLQLQLHKLNVSCWQLFIVNTQSRLLPCRHKPALQYSCLDASISIVTRYPVLISIDQSKTKITRRIETRKTVPWIGYILSTHINKPAWLRRWCNVYHAYFPLYLVSQGPCNFRSGLLTLMANSSRMFFDDQAVAVHVFHRDYS